VNPKLTIRAARSGGVFSRRDALECGYTIPQIKARLAAGKWQRLRRGIYAEQADLSQLPVWERESAEHRLAVHAAVRALAPGSAVVSHHSALVMHEVPVWGVDLDEVHVTRQRSKPSGSVAAGIVQHTARFTDEDLTELAGLRVSTVPRALAEMACVASFESIVVSADAALRAKQFYPEDARRVLELTRSWPGAAMARAAIPFASRQAESVGESRLRVLMDRCDLPKPVLQAVIRDAAGTFVARVDFYFPEFRTIVEFDGLTKYGTADDLVAEKAREDRLRALGYQVVRVIWKDLPAAPAVADRIRDAFAAAR
jgi:very-short-patch-repair endonuclease